MRCTARVTIIRGERGWLMLRIRQICVSLDQVLWRGSHGWNIAERSTMSSIVVIDAKRLFGTTDSE